MSPEAASPFVREHVIPLLTFALKLLAITGGTYGVVAIGFHIASVGASRLGWRGLANAYPAGAQPPDGIILRKGRIATGFMNYGSLRIIVAREGIHVSTDGWALDERFFPPLLLPWSGVMNVDEKHFLMLREGEIRFSDAAGWDVELTFPPP